MALIMGRRSHKLLYAIFTLLLHLKPALGFISKVGDDNVWCIERERQALLEFKEKLIDNTNMLSSWGSEDAKKNCCSWEGVQCNNQTGHVLELHLDFYGLRGKISPSLIELHHLTDLGLSGNDFNISQIPKFIGSLSNLKHLDLNGANLSGPIPFQLGNLSNLQYLDLSWNNLKLVQNLEWLSHLVSIEHLDLSNLNLGVANDWLKVVSGLPNLSELWLYNCSLPLATTSPLLHINSSKSLTYLDLSNNPCINSSVFSWMLNSSTNLAYVDLSSNQLRGSIPNVFGNMNSLERLDLHDNQFEGGIPKSLGDICTLRGLYLSSNNLNGQVLEFFHNLQGCAKDSLESLHLGGNQIKGSMPKFAKFPSLRELDLSNNKLNGSVPEKIETLYKLEFLDLRSNMLKGVISETLLSNFPNLFYLQLSSNSFTSNFSFDWIPPFQLNDLYLRSCKLGPHFPNWIKTQKNLIFLDLSNTRISNTIPTWFWDMPFELYYLNLSQNKIKGRLPNISYIFSDLAILDFSSNKFEGPLPAVSSNLTSLNLSKNKFLGLNSFICSITGDLSQNNISGTIPHCLNNFNAMAHKISDIMTDKYSTWNGPEYSFYTDYGKYSDNSLNIIVGWKGNLYEYGKNFGEMRSIDLANNELTGNIPEEISSLIELKALNLSGNTLTGEIPQDIGKLEQLESLDLSRNRFSGSLPASMVGLHYLGYLDLSYNKLSGRIPTGTQLQSFDPSKFMGNVGLCGPPLIEKCPEDVTSNVGGSKNHQEDRDGGSKNHHGYRDEFWKCLYVGTGFGFAAGFWGVCVSLILNRSWRHAYFLTLINLKDWLYVTIVVHTKILREMFHN
ncbi:receptor-like protein eix2 [Quercus suber]|uniref:Receptor-like protein eix2 n=1 Tax=Quercus suber TaxID=58331 RepID=A0AAW0KPA5_QUESU